MSEQTPDSAARAKAWYRAAVGSAVAAGAFSLAVGALVVFHSIENDPADPLASPRMKQLRDRLRLQPGNDPVKRQIRELDLQLREEFFSGRQRVATGGWLLLVGVAVCLIALKLACDLRKKLPRPGPTAQAPDARERQAARARRAVLAVVVVLAAAAAVPAVRRRPPVKIPAKPAPVDPARQWPRFRGPGGLGISIHAGVPASFDGAAGKGVLWKAPVPLPGKSSPVVWAERVFLTGATAKNREVYCFDAGGGKLLWRGGVTTPGRGKKAPEVSKDTGYAAPTPAVDGRRVFALFANGDLACFDLSGKGLWARDLGLPENVYGHASSLATHGGALLVQYDQGTDAEEEKSELIALDVRTGRVLWTTPRPVYNSWSTPIVIRTPKGHQIVAAGDPWVIAYRPADGVEIWRADCISGEVGPSPAYGGGLVFAANTGAYLAAIRPDGSGNVTETHVAWKGEDGLPDTCSPLADGKRVYVMDPGGYLTCYDAAKGKVLWEHDFETPFQASPTLVGDRLYLLDTKGDLWIAAAADKYSQLGRASLGEPADATPAFADGRIYIRGERHLFCVGKE